MASEKISQLPTVTQSTIGINSIFPVVDSVDSTTKSIAINQLDLRWVNQVMTEPGDMIYGGASGIPTRLAGNATTPTFVLTSTGTGSAATAPVWALPAASTTVNVTGHTALSGAVTFSAGTAISLTQTGQNIAIAFTGVTGTIPIASGGTGQTTAAAAFNALSPLTTLGDIIYGGTSGAGTRLAGNTTTIPQVLSQTGTGSASAAPVWVNGGTGIAPTIQKFISGSGTYTTPVGVSYIHVEMVGGGAGGQGSGQAGGGTGSTAGGNTTFGTSLLVANGGALGGLTVPGAGGLGGTASLGTGPIGVALSGGAGGANSTAPDSSPSLSGGGGSSALGGAAGGSSQNTAGVSASANTGSGGSGGGGNTSLQITTGSGGGSGGYVEAIIVSPLSSYSYSVGSAGSGGSATTSGFIGGNGAAGVIIVTEYYSPVVIAGSGGAVTPTTQSFTSSGTYTPTQSGLVYALVTVIGGGGGGGGGANSTAAAGAGGGGAGGTTISLLTAAAIGSSQAITIGGGGSAGAVGGTGGTGVTSSFGILLSASGGAGGTGSSSVSSPGVGGAGGVGTGGSVNIAGDGGGAGSVGITGVAGGTAGAGGGSYFGGAAAGGLGAGAIGKNFGGGGGGGAQNSVGGAGSAGFIFIQEYYANGAIGTATNVTGVVAPANGGTGQTGPVALRVHTVSALSITANTNIAYDLVDFDTKSGYSAGTYTVPTTGIYMVSCSILLSGVNQFPVLTHNGTQVSVLSQLNGGGSDSVGSDLISCTAGDTLSIQNVASGTMLAATATNQRNFMSIHLIH
jgi:hypothetical protein